MLFTVTYRTPDGALGTEMVEASCRSDCFAKMRARGIAPMSISADVKKRSYSTSPMGRLKIILIVIGIGVLAAAFWYCFDFGTEVSQTEHLEPKKVVKAASKISPSKDMETKLDTFQKRNGSQKNNHLSVKKSSDRSNRDVGQEVNKKIKVMPSLRTRNPNRRRLFTNHVMCELQHYIIPGQDMPPPDKISNEEALEAANMKIEYFDSDTDEELERKKAVEEMLIEMKQYIIAGGSANDFMHRLAARQELEAQAVDETRRNVRALIREGKMKDAKSALSAYNEYLKSKGIPEVYVKGLE